MGKIRNSESGFSIVEGLLVVLVLAVIGFGGYYVYHSQKNSNKGTMTSTATKSSSSDTNTATAANTPQYIAYGTYTSGSFGATGGIAINSSSAVIKLTGASSKLKSYLTNPSKDTTTCSDNSFEACIAGSESPQNTIISTYGDFAVSNTPNEAVLLGPDSISGQIVQITGEQSVQSCSDLRQIIIKYDVPSGLYSKDDFFKCDPGNGGDLILYSQYNG